MLRAGGGGGRWAEQQNNSLPKPTPAEPLDSSIVKNAHHSIAKHMRASAPRARPALPAWRRRRPVRSGSTAFGGAAGSRSSQHDGPGCLLQPHACLLGGRAATAAHTRASGGSAQRRSRQLRRRAAWDAHAVVSKPYSLPSCGRITVHKLGCRGTLQQGIARAK